jgi:uncharacterized membrane protein
MRQADVFVVSGVVSALCGIAQGAVSPSITAVRLNAGDSFVSFGGVSGDGRYLFGATGDVASTAPFRWSPTDGYQPMPVPSGWSVINPGGVNFDGSVLVGSATTNNGNNRDVFRWTFGSSAQSIAQYPSFYSLTPNHVSGDGGVVVGSYFTGDFTGYRWTQGTGTTVVPGGGGATQTSVRNISSNGQVYVGTSGPSAARWTSGGLQLINGLPGAAFSVASATNSDGSIAVGVSDFGSQGSHLFRWTSSGTTDLGVPGATPVVWAMTPDGSTVLGSVVVANQNPQSFIWRASSGIQTLQSYLTSQGVNTNGWSLGGPLDISDDGSIIAGTGNYQGAGAVFYAVVPSPGCAGIGLSVLSLVLRRPRRSDQARPWTPLP